MESLPEAEAKEILEVLDAQRASVVSKVEGASEEHRRERLVPSETTLLGMVKHLAYAERWWFQDRFSGRDVTYPWSDDDPDADFYIEDEDSRDVFAFYREECEKSRAIITAATLGTRAAYGTPGWPPATLFWILLHMIEETARHAGHADILREQTDGSTGD